jgi:hypothetical protein
MDEFAPLYSTRERIGIALKMLAVAASLYLPAHFWFIPWLENYISFANCYYYGDISGMHLLIYGIFVFAPLSLALLIWLLEGRRCLEVLRIRQNPLPGEKVLRKTRGLQAEKLTRSITPCSNEQLQQLKIRLD